MSASVTSSVSCSSRTHSGRHQLAGTSVDKKAKPSFNHTLERERTISDEQKIQCKGTTPSVITGSVSQSNASQSGFQAALVLPTVMMLSLISLIRPEEWLGV